MLWSVKGIYEIAHSNKIDKRKFPSRMIKIKQVTKCAFEFMEDKFPQTLQNWGRFQKIIEVKRLKKDLNKKGT